MKTFIVHTRPKEDFDLEKFYTWMKSYPHWARLMEDLWMVSCDGNATQIRDGISQATEKKCDIMVINISGAGWATLNIDRAITDWMTENI